MASPQAEQAPLNIDSVEKQVENIEMARQDSQKSRIEEIGEKVKRPAITTSLIVYLILNIIMFFVGIFTTKDCPIKPIIPVYLAVAGGLGIVTKILPIVNAKCFNSAIVERLVYALFVIEVIWMVLGSIWIYSIYEPPYTPLTDQPHCNKTAYLLAFWLLTINYILLLLLIAIPCLFLCCFLIFTMVVS